MLHTSEGSVFHRLVRRHWALLAALPALSSCGGDDCWNCGRGPAPVYIPSEISLGLVAGNFNGNGHTSVIATSAVQYYAQGNTGYLKSYLSTGAGSFAAPVLTADGTDPLYLVSADLTGDGLPDVVSASYNDGDLEVFLNNKGSPGSFSTPVILNSPGASQAAIGDMNNDGMPDIVSADFNVSLFLQTAPGVFAAPVTLYSGGANWVAVGDLNGDGIPDVALVDNVGVKLLLHTGAASSTTYAAPVSVFTQTANANLVGANVVAIADVNGDGFNDLIITDPGPTGGAAPTVSVLLQDATHLGTFLPAVSYAIAPDSLVQSIVVTDVNGDGHPDIVIGGSNAVSVLLQDASTPGSFLAASNYTVSNANEIAVADVNGDGLLDIIIGTGMTQSIVNGIYPNTPGVLLQSASSPGTFGALQNLP
jgi:hypothetical protein